MDIAGHLHIVVHYTWHGLHGLQDMTGSRRLLITHLKGGSYNAWGAFGRDKSEQSTHYPKSVYINLFLKSRHSIRPVIKSWILFPRDILSFPSHVFLLIPAISNKMITKYFIALGHTSVILLCYYYCINVDER